MADFSFLQDRASKKWVISAPRRAERPNAGKVATAVCPFCIGNEQDEEELFRVGGKKHDSNWHIRVIPNKFPFTQHHEIIIHSPDHHKNIDELPFSQVELILRTYRDRYRANRKYGQVYLFHNRGVSAGESLPHPHTQLVVVPRKVVLDIPPLDMNIDRHSGKRSASRISHRLGFRSRRFAPPQNDVLETEQFFVFCPKTSEWPDEVWIAPKRDKEVFGSIANQEITDLGFVLSRVIQIFDLRHGYEFPFNFYIYPGKNWYLRLIPRIKILGGFELGTHIGVNTQDPAKTFSFIQEHFWQPKIEKIKRDHQAEYWRSV